jgi:hypothetical protein
VNGTAIGGFVAGEHFHAALRRCDLQEVVAHPLVLGAYERRRLHLDELLDHALDESLPAGDSPSISSSG